MKIFSSMTLNEELREESGAITLALCKVGTLASDVDGKIYRLTEAALSSDAPTWKGGIIRVNHDTSETGIISEAWYEAPYVMGRIEGLTSIAKSIISSPAYLGVSQESQPTELGEVVEIKGHEVREVNRLQGTGVSIMVYPYKPACQLSEGCGIPIASADVSNLSLNTDSTKIETEPPGGPTMDENNIQNTEIEKLKAELETLRAANADLEAQTAKIPELVETGITAGLASQAVKMEKENKLNEALAELKSCLPEGFDEFVAQKPSLEIVQGFIRGLKSANPVGAPRGADVKHDNKLYSSGKELYDKLGIAPDDLAKYNEVE